MNCTLNTGGEGVDRDIAGSVTAVTGVCLVLKDGTCQDGAVCELQIEIADAVPEDIAAHFLRICGKGAVSTIFSGLAPAAFVGVSGAF